MTESSPDQGHQSRLRAGQLRSGDEGSSGDGSATLDLTAAEQTFIRESTAARDDADRDEADRSEREKTMAGRVRRRTYGLVVIVVTLIAGGAAAWLFAGGDPLPQVAYAAGPFGEDASVEVQMRAGWAQAQRQLDFEAILLEPISDTAEEIDALADSGPDLIVSSQEIVDVIPPVAIAHPDTQFVAFHNFAVDFGIDNLTTITIDSAEGSFLAGAAAALTTETGVIGFLGGWQDIIDQFRAGYEAGARHINPDIEIESRFLVTDGDSTVFGRPAQGAEAARELFSAGADVVFQAAGNSGDLVPSMAEEMTEPGGPKRWAIGVDTDQWLAVDGSIRDHVLTSMIKRNDFAIRVSIERFMSGELESGVISLGLRDGAVGYSTSGDNLTAATIRRLDELIREVVDGAIVGPAIPDAPPTISPPADVKVTVTWDGTSCTVGSGASAVSVGDVLRVDFENRSDRPWFVQGFRGAPTQGQAVLNLAAEPESGNSGTMNVTREGPRTLACTDFETAPVVATVLDVEQPDADSITGTLTIHADGCTYNGATSVPVGSKIIVDTVRGSDVDAGKFFADSGQPVGFWNLGPGEEGLIGLSLVPPATQIAVGCLHDSKAPEAIFIDG